MDNDFIWLVGILEGEGSFHFHKRGQQCSISICMKDEDVVRRVARIMDVKCYGPYRNAKKPAHSAVFQVQVRSLKAIEWMEKLEPHMSIRRSAQIKDCLAKYSVRTKMTLPEAMAVARKSRFATEEQRLAQRDQALKIGLGKEVRPN